RSAFRRCCRPLAPGRRSMSNPGEISREYYSAEGAVEQGSVAEEISGSHFSEICGNSVGIFVPLIGVTTDLGGAALSRAESIGTLEHLTWRSLENRRYRDLFEGSMMLQPRVYYRRLFPELESEEAGAAFAEALVDTQTPEHAKMATRLEALAVGLLTGESGALISPDRVQWTVTHRFTRLRLPGDRPRVYSWTMRD